jgi:hypothetical protein
VKRRARVSLDESENHHLEATARMTAAQRLAWLDEAFRFSLKSIPKSTLKAMIKLRTREQKYIITL